MSGRESKRGVTSMTHGTKNLVAYYRSIAEHDDCNMFVGPIWEDGYPRRVGIWLYKYGEPTKANPPVAEAATLDALYGRT